MRAILSVLIVVAGCASPVAPGGAVKSSETAAPTAGIAPGGGTGTTAPGAPTDACMGAAGCVNAADVPLHWPGFLGLAWPDLTGDGLTDVVVRERFDADPSHVFTGPHAVARADLSGAAVTWTGNVLPVGDIDGDGSRDLVRSDDHTEMYSYLVGPFHGSVDAWPVALEIAEFRNQDFDGDGIVDQLTGTGDGSTALYPGPLTNWGVHATATFEWVPHPDDSADCAARQSIAYSTMDLDGDGAPEAILNSGIHPDCPQNDGWVLLDGFSGSYQLRRDATPPGLTRYVSGWLVPDQDGDAIMDTVIPELADDGVNEVWALYSGPMGPVDGVMGPTGPHLVDVPTTDQFALGLARPVFDVDGDGITDFLWVAPRDHFADSKQADARLIRGGVAALGGEPEVLGWWGARVSTPGGGGPNWQYVPEERLLLLQDGEEIAVIPLDP